jgi:hypothetical protein
MGSATVTTVLKVTAEEFDQALDRVEADLLALRERLRKPVENDLVHTTLLVLGTRASSLFRGFVVLAGSDAPSAALALMRPAVEINLMLRFIVANPELHAELWVAEGERESLKLIREFAADPELAAKDPALDPASGWATERADYIEEVRAKALAAGVIGVSTKAGGGVMPDMRTIAFSHGDQATREAYTLAYRALSQDVHGGSRAFGAGRFDEVATGRVAFTEFADPVHEVRRNRALNATTFASTLCILSGPLELDVLEEADMLKQILMSITVDAEETATT